jgi:hypothetical protein
MGCFENLLIIKKEDEKKFAIKVTVTDKNTKNNCHPIGLITKII